VSELIGLVCERNYCWKFLCYQVAAFERKEVAASYMIEEQRREQLLSSDNIIVFFGKQCYIGCISLSVNLQSVSLLRELLFKVCFLGAIKEGGL